jgi:hypothetical protein
MCSGQWLRHAPGFAGEDREGQGLLSLMREPRLSSHLYPFSYFKLIPCPSESQFSHHLSHRIKRWKWFANWNSLHHHLQASKVVLSASLLPAEGTWVTTVRVMTPAYFAVFWAPLCPHPFWVPREWNWVGDGVSSYLLWAVNCLLNLLRILNKWRERWPSETDSSYFPTSTATKSRYYFLVAWECFPIGTHLRTQLQANTAVVTF